MVIKDIQWIQNCALLTAADYGHHRCVRILIKNGADVKKKDDTDKNNCLMKAIEKNHRYSYIVTMYRISHRMGRG